LLPDIGQGQRSLEVAGNATGPNKLADEHGALTGWTLGAP
jgi:hypothetical protein